MLPVCHYYVRLQRQNFECVLRVVRYFVTSLVVVSTGTLVDCAKRENRQVFSVKIVMLCSLRSMSTQIIVKRQR
jgi:hypothetical protein